MSLWLRVSKSSNEFQCVNYVNVRTRTDWGLGSVSWCYHSTDPPVESTSSVIGNPDPTVSDTTRQRFLEEGHGLGSDKWNKR